MGTPQGFSKAERKISDNHYVVRKQWDEKTKEALPRKVVLRLPTWGPEITPTNDCSSHIQKIKRISAD